MKLVAEVQLCRYYTTLDSAVKLNKPVLLHLTIAWIALHKFLNNTGEC